MGDKCIMCDQEVIKDDPSEIYSSFCGSLHPECRIYHAVECEECRKEFDIDEDEVECDGCAVILSNIKAAHVARVSRQNPHDGLRMYCEVCHDVYMVGVQHGRHHEAALHSCHPGRDSSQDRPASKDMAESK